MSADLGGAVFLFVRETMKIFFTDMHAEYINISKVERVIFNERATAAELQIGQRSIFLDEKIVLEWVTTKRQLIIQLEKWS